MKLRLLAAAALLTATAAPALPFAATPTVSAACAFTNVLLPPGTVARVAYPRATGADIQCLETRLKDLGYAVGTPDTVYDSASVAAVKAFQVSRGLYPDGVVTAVVSRQLGLRGGALPSGPTVPKVTILGDSTSAAIRWTDEINNNSDRYDVIGNTYDLQIALESCRRLMVTSCLSRTNNFTSEKIVPVSVLPLMQTSLKGRLGDAIVIMAGYDDYSITSAIDQIMTEARAQGVSRVFWLNYRLTNSYNPAYQGYYTKHNSDLEWAKLRWPNLTVLDWNGYSRYQSSWFSSDGIHFTAAGATQLALYIKAALDGSDLRGCVAGNANAGVPSGAVGTPADPADTATGYQPLGPTRVLDTRNPAQGGGNGRLRAERTITVPLPSLPDGASAAVLNVTAVTPCNIGFLTVFACGTRPNTSNVNFVAGRTTAGMVITPHSSGSVCIHTSATVDVVVDLVGAFVPAGALFHPTGPTRWIDTRGQSALLPITGAITTGSWVEVPIAGQGGVPADATAVWLNVTATRSPTNTVVQVYPGPCSTPPGTSTVNVLAGRSAANAALVALGPNGSICVRAFSGTPDVIIDVAGWFGGPVDGGLALHVGAPYRPLDTRPGALPAAGATQTIGAATTTVYNVTSVNSTGFGFVTAIPCGSASNASLVNNAPTEPTANLGVVAPGTGGNVCFTPMNFASDLVIDVAGTFEPVPV